MPQIEWARSSLRRCAPAVALLGAVFATLVPFHLGALGVSVPMPLLPMIVVFLYAVYAPTALPTWAVFCVGLVHDFLYGGALGVWASVYVALQFLVATQRDYFRGRVFHVIWLAFVLALVAVAPLLWIERSMLVGRFLSVWPLMGQFVATAIMYPAVAWVFFALRDNAMSEVTVK